MNRKFTGKAHAGESGGDGKGCESFQQMASVLLVITDILPPSVIGRAVVVEAGVEPASLYRARYHPK